MEIVPPSTDIGTEPLRQHNKSTTTTPTTHRSQYHQQTQQSTRLHQHHHHHNQSYTHQQQQLRNNSQHQKQKQPKDGTVLVGGPVIDSGGGGSSSSLDPQVQSSMAYQHKHALHRLRRLKKRAPHRDLVISFVPRLRISIINRLDFFHRYSKQEQEVLSCFDFLDELVLNYCDGGLDSPRYSQKLYETMIYELI